MFQRRMFIFLLTVLLTIPATTVNAQTPAAQGTPAEDELAGLQAAVFRRYAPTGEFVGKATIIIDDATPVSPGAGTTGLRSISVLVREFDTAEHAASAFTQFSADAEASLPGAFQDGTLKITSTELPDIGSQATRIRGDYTEPGVAVWLEYVFVQRDQYVFFISADASVFLHTPGSDDVNKSLPTVAIATAIATNGEPSPDEPAFVEGGTSSGGLWGFMLPAGDPLLAGLVPTNDGILFPPPSA